MSPARMLIAGGFGLIVFAFAVYKMARGLRVPSMLLMLVGAGAVVLGFRPSLIIESLPRTMRIFMGGVSILYCYITMEAVRRNALKERYAILWILTGLVLFAFAVNPEFIAWLVAITGMHYTSAIVVVVFSFLILIAFHVSLTLSRNEDDRRRLAQQIALLEERIRELESSSPKTPSPRE